MSRLGRERKKLVFAKSPAVLILNLYPELKAGSLNQKSHQEAAMKKEYKNKNMSCSLECKKEYEECIEKGEHESVCNMKRAHCDCACYE